MAAQVRGDGAERSFLIQEHRDLRHGLGRIHELAAELTRIALPEESVRLAAVIRWFDGAVAPHMAWEDGRLYPELEREATSPWLTTMFRSEHAAIREEAEHLRAEHDHLAPGVVHEVPAEVAWHLVALEALLRDHIEREERFIVALLDGARDDARPTRPAAATAATATRTTATTRGSAEATGGRPEPIAMIRVGDRR